MKDYYYRKAFDLSMIEF